MLLTTVLILLLINRNYYRANNFLVKEDSFYRGLYPGTTDTGESSPRWSVRFMEHYPATSLAVIEGKAVIKKTERLTDRHTYRLEAATPVRLVENTLYFPGWQIFVDDQPVEIEFQDPNFRGLMTFLVPAGNHQVSVLFRETKLRLLADWVSLTSLVILFLSGKMNLRKAISLKRKHRVRSRKL